MQREASSRPGIVLLCRDREKEGEKPTEQKATEPADKVSSMRVAVLLPLLLCAAAHVSQVRAEVKAVKLCGREFLRAVVYTCGGSRWRRVLAETDMDADAGLPMGEQSSLESLSSSISNLNSQLSRRDINSILTMTCCQVGCRKSDLTHLC